MKGLITILLFYLLSILQGFSSDIPDSLVLSGNKAYNEANYEEAARHYQSVIDNGFASASLYYNLGNSYFKLNNIPAAILYYEKALKLDPKDEDINFNLNLANSRIIDKIEPVPEFFIRKWWNQLVMIMLPAHWGIITIMFFILLLVSITVFIISRSVLIRKISFWAGSLVLVLTLISFYIGNRSLRVLQDQQHGIIFTPTVTVKSSPTDNSVDLFVIHEGTKVELLDKLEGWSEVKIANGSIGWVRDSDYKAI
jgi:tetratricopeptide (TPR) repeat protein